MRVGTLLVLMLAGCGPVRMDAVQRGGAEASQRLYTRDDPDGRAAALESTGGDGCREARQGRWVMALCSEPENLRAGSPSLLKFQIDDGAPDRSKPSTGTLIAVGLRHKGGREASLTHPDPTVSGVKETSPGNFEATAVFPAEGRWTVEAAVMFPDGEGMRLKFDVVVAPGAPAR